MPEEKPPILKTWNRVYLMVIGVLVALIIVFYFITKHFE